MPPLCQSVVTVTFPSARDSLFPAAVKVGRGPGWSDWLERLRRQRPWRGRSSGERAWADRLGQRAFGYFLAGELVDGGQEYPFVSRKVLGRLTGRRGKYDSHQVVGTEMLLDKPARSIPRASRPLGSGTGVVEDRHVDAAVEAALVTLHVRLNRNRRRDGLVVGMSTSENAASGRGLPSSRI